MADVTQSKIQLIAEINISNTLALGSAAYSARNVIDQVLVTGTGAGQANQIITDEVVLTADETLNITLNSAATENPLAEQVFLTKVKVILVEASASNAHNISIGDSPTNTFDTIFINTDSAIILRPGGTFLLMDSSVEGYTVVPNTGHQLRFKNEGSASTVSCKMTIVGVV